MPLSQLSKFASKHGVTYPLICDSQGVSAQKYGVDAIPETFVFDASGKVAGSSWKWQKIAAIVRSLVGHTSNPPQEGSHRS